MKKGIMAIVLFLFGCSMINEQTVSNDLNDEYEDVYAGISIEDTFEIMSYGDLSYDPNDSDEMANRSSDVVLVTILSIDGGATKNEYTDEYVYPYTYGRLVVHEVYKGNLSIGDEIIYTRTGGIVSVDDYYASLHDAQREKIMSEGGIKQAYVKIMFDNDISIEVGKTYLVYLGDDTMAYPPIKDSYIIQGFQGGMRKIQDSVERSTSENRQVFNNYTQSWENLDHIVSDIE